MPFSFNRRRLSHWTTPDLVKYLISVRPAPREIENLRQAPAFAQEETAGRRTNEDGTPKEVPRFKASDLYVPSDVFRSLGLPIIDWCGEDGKHEWKPDSEEGIPDTVLPLCVLTFPSLAKFLLDLGLRWYPPAKVLLDIAAEGGPRGVAALDYFLENYGQNHTDYKEYTAYAKENIAFVPAIQKGQKKLVKPVEVFAKPDWETLGFPILDPTLEEDAVYKLGIKEHPPTSQLVNCLKTSPPTTEAQAREWFGVLSRRISGLCNIQSDKCACVDPGQTSPLLSWLYYPRCASFLPPTISPSPQALDWRRQTNATLRANPTINSIPNCSPSSTLVLRQTVF